MVGLHLQAESSTSLLLTIANGFLQQLTEAWDKEREEMKQLQAIKAEMERVNLEIQNAERAYALNRAAELKYGVLVGLQKQLKQLEEELRQQVQIRHQFSS